MKEKGGQGSHTLYTSQTMPLACDYLRHYEELGDVIPSLAGLACALGVSKRTITNWVKEEEKEDFARLVDAIRAKQERILLTKGLTGDFNSGIVKLLLSGHGHVERQAQEISGPDGGAIETKWSVTIKAPGPVKAIDCIDVEHKRLSGG